MELKMRNYVEDILRERMPKILGAMPDICRCDRCEMDRLAFALNKLPPKYVVTQTGKLYAKLNLLIGQFDADIVRAVTDAAIAVDGSPRHDDE